MNSLKTLSLVIVLAAVAYGVYVGLTGAPPSKLPPELPGGSRAQAPSVELPSAPPATGLALPSTSGGQAPSYAPPAPTGELPSSSGALPQIGTNLGQLPLSNPEVKASASAAMPSASMLGNVSALAPNAAPSAALPSAALPSAAASGNASALAPAAPSASASAAAATTSPAAQPIPTADSGALRPAEVLLSQGRLADALEELTLHRDDPSLSARERAWQANLLDDLAGSVIYSREHLLEPAYVVKPGDTLDAIAAQYNVPPQLLAKINGIRDPQSLPPGAQLKVVRGPFSAIVKLDSHQLILMLGGRYAGHFTIGLGRDSTAAPGEFTVKDKVANPTYYGPDRVIDADDPNNPLGERWIDLGHLIGLHGTNDPSSVTRDESRGCIRLAPSDIDDVYDMLTVGSKVIIRR